MELDDFIRRLTQLSAAELTSLAARVAAIGLDDDVAWWRATLAVDGSLRRAHRSTRSAAAASAAVRAVVAAAHRAGLDAAAPDVARLAKAAGDTARALVAEDPGVEPCYFFELWSGLLRLPAWAPCTGPLAA